jgi:asparagine synthase (glutamine-hydrolysing)
MCGIFASTRLDLWHDRLDDVLAALRHRGPDAQGLWRDDAAGVVLAHTRLSIVGLGPEGDQPQIRGTSVLAYNGELYNHAGVARSLGLAPPACDTETVHEVLRRNGPAGLGAFDGMYALARWDGAERRLLAARDWWGVKPLYVWRHAGGGVTVASEPAVLALLRPGVDPVGLAQYLAFGHTTPTATVYEGVSKLPPGAVATWTMAGTGWRVSAGQVPLDAAGPDPATPPDPDELGRLVRQSVRAQLMADVPVGVFLSGGVDSTLIAAAAAGEDAAPHCFTLSFPDAPAIDESPRAAANARRLGLAHTAVPVTAAELVRRLPLLVRSTGEPMGDAAALAVDLLAERAVTDVKVVLTGEGADELFGGYVRHKLTQKFARARVGLMAPALRTPAQLAARHRGDRPWHRAVVAGLHGGGPLGYAVLQQGELDVLRPRPDLVRSLTAQLRTDWEMATESVGSERAPLAFDQRRWLPNTYLEKIDRSSMRHGLEGRVPFLGAALTAWADVRQPFGKAPLLDELIRLLPGVELPDRKKGLAIDVRALLAAGLQAEADRVLRDPDSVIARTLGPLPDLARRAERSPTFAYRLATIAAWEATLDVRV